MDTASFQFVLFGLLVALVSNLSRSPFWRSLVLLAATLYFLYVLAVNPIVLLPLAGFLALGYFGLFLLQRGVRKSLVWFILVVVFAYIWLKKYTILPGPIQRYDDFAADQFAPDPPPLGPKVVGLQLERIVRGFFKVNVLALLLNAFQLDALVQISQPLPITFKMWAAFRIAVIYPFFIYCNFSGYIDIVIAIARLMRLRLPENFNRPFSASSFLEFWNRWHITLSTWLKNYVYNPLLLALMRRITSRTLEPFLGVFCFFVTFFLVGVWHGRTSEFLFYGVLQGAGMAANKLWQLALAGALGRKPYKALAKNPFYIAFGRGLTFTWFAFTLFWFWGDWSKINKVLSALQIQQWALVSLAIWLSSTLILASWEWLRAALLSIRTSEGSVLLSRYARVAYASALGLAAVVITLLLNQPAPGIVYKAF